MSDDVYDDGDSGEHIFDPDEVMRMLIQAMEHAGEEGMTAPEVEKFYDLMSEAGTLALLLDMWRAGAVTVGYDREEDMLRWFPVSLDDVPEFTHEPEPDPDMPPRPRGRFVIQDTTLLPEPE